MIGDLSRSPPAANPLTLTASAQIVAGVSYTHASGSRTVSAGTGTFQPTITSTDQASPANTSAFPFSVVVDNTAPVPFSTTLVNGTGSTAGQIDGGDVITFSWTETSGIDPRSISGTWDGTALQVSVDVQNIKNNDTVTIFNQANTAQLTALGSIGTGGNWVSANLSLPATMTWSSASPDRVVVTMNTTTSSGRLTSLRLDDPHLDTEHSPLRLRRKRGSEYNGRESDRAQLLTEEPFPAAVQPRVEKDSRVYTAGLRLTAWGMIFATGIAGVVHGPWWIVGIGVVGARPYFKRAREMTRTPGETPSARCPRTAP